MATYARDEVTFNIVSAEDYIYVGFEKPINAFYIDITTANGLAGSMVLECWNGTTYAACANKSDDTQGFFRSGFVRWDREQTNQVANEVNSSTMYWYRITLDTDRTGMVISGLNLVFSDDYELSLEQPYISDSEFLGSESSHIKAHAAVKREILQKFRNKNYTKINADGEREDINVWDLLFIDEVRLAATYLALSKIYYGLSDNADDVWASKSAKYEDKFNKFINIARLSIDTDDDGLVSVDENKPAFRTRHLNR